MVSGFFKGGVSYRIPPMSLTKLLPPLPPSNGFTRPCYVAFGLSADKKQRKTVNCYSPEELVQACATFMENGWHSYFAQAAFTDAIAGRKQANADSLKTFWVDLDVGKKNNSYATREDALMALLSFAKDTGLKPSCVVDSGVGFYAYWILDEAISAARWRKLAQWFAAAIAKQGMIVDPACTCDSARVLRMPGTIHQGCGRQVSIIANYRVSYTWKKFAELLHGVCLPPWNGVPDTPKSAAPVQGNALFDTAYGMGNSPIRAYAEPIVNACEQIRTAGLGSEPQWYAMMSVMRRCIDGNEWAHKLSAMDQTRYDWNDTEAKFYHAPEDAPAKCTSFDGLNPGVCSHCPYHGQITSPVQLWRKQGAVTPLEPQASPAPAAPSGDYLQLPATFSYPPKAFNNGEFSVDSQGVHWFESKYDKTTGSWTTHDHVITRSQLYYQKTVWQYEKGQSHRQHWFLIVNPNGQKSEVYLDAETASSAQSLMAWMYSSNVFPTTTSYGAKIFMSFINAYLTTVMGNGHMVEIPTTGTFGWRQGDTLAGQSAGFVTGSGLITDNGVENIELTGAAQRVAQGLGAAGTLAGWKPVAEMYKTLNQPVAQLAMCLSFAAPLMKYGSGVATSATFSLWSTQSGLGKTQLLRAAASVWGNPDGQWIQRQASAVARMRHLAVLNNIPAFMDELTDVSDEDLYSLAYSLVGGMEKNKLRRNGVDMMETGSWNTVTFCTSNKSIKEAVAHCAGDSAASVARVIEYECDFQSYMDDAETQSYINDCIAQCATNYGLAGPNFIYNVMRHADRLATLTSQCEHWAQKHGFRNEERFMAYPLALAIKAGRWACEWGLLDYDMDELEKWVLSVFVPHNRQETKSQVKTSRSVLLTYLMERQRNFLQVEEDIRTSAIPAPNMPDPYVQIMPAHSDVFIRLAAKENVLYIAKSDITKWCKRGGLSVNTLWKKLAREGIVAREAMYNLSSGVASLTTPTTMCYVLDAASVIRLGFNAASMQQPSVKNVAPQVM